MKRNIFFLSLLLIALLGLGLSLWFAWQIPLWLDERYSLYFAALYSPLQLLVKSPDTHPGLFYLITQRLVSYTNDVWTLRVVLGVLPQWTGAAITVFWMIKKRLSRPSVLIAALFLFLNPFVIYTTAQIRMYGVVSFFSLLTFVCLQEWKEKPSVPRYILLLLVLLIGCAVSYSLIFLGIGVLAFMLVRYFQTRRQLYQPLLLAAALPTAFLILAGSAVKDTFEWGASWILLPSFTSIPSLFWTIVGIDTNLFMNAVPFGLGTILFYGVLTYLLFKTTSARLSVLAKQQSEVISIVLFPILFITFISFVLPFLSQRFFFYQFVPKLSLFLPRVFLPLLLIASSSIALATNQFSRKVVIVIGVLLFFWAGTYVAYGQIAKSDRTRSSHQDSVVRQVHQLEDSVKEEVIWLPSWAWINTVNPDSVIKMAEVDAKIKRSEEVEEHLFSNSDNKNCNVPKQAYVVVSDELAAESVQKYYADAEATLERCCTPQDENNFKRWYCK